MKTDENLLAAMTGEKHSTQNTAMPLPTSSMPLPQQS